MIEADTGSRSVTAASAHCGVASELNMAEKNTAHPARERPDRKKKRPMQLVQCSASRRYSTRSSDHTTKSTFNSSVMLSNAPRGPSALKTSIPKPMSEKRRTCKKATNVRTTTDIAKPSGGSLLSSAGVLGCAALDGANSSAGVASSVIPFQPAAPGLNCGDSSSKVIPLAVPLAAELARSRALAPWRAPRLVQLDHS